MNLGRSCSRTVCAVARKASTTAVRGKAWMNGWIDSGNREAEKNTPEKIHIGSITRFISPDAPSMVCTREDTRRPIEVKASDDSTQRDLVG